MRYAPSVASVRYYRTGLMTQSVDSFLLINFFQIHVAEHVRAVPEHHEAGAHQPSHGHDTRPILHLWPGEPSPPFYSTV